MWVLFLCFFDPTCMLLKSMVQESIHEVIPSSLNKTFLSLIPKLHCRETFNQFCPISLYNTIYKIFTKILVNRLRPFLNKKSLTPYKVVFYRIVNFIIVQETLNCFKKKKEEPNNRVLWPLNSLDLQFLVFILLFLDINSQNIVKWVIDTIDFAEFLTGKTKWKFLKTYKVKKKKKSFSLPNKKKN